MAFIEEEIFIISLIVVDLNGVLEEDLPILFTTL